MTDHEIFTFPGFMTPELCQTYIRVIEAQVEASNFTNSGLFSNKKWINPDLSRLFYNRLKDMGFPHGLRPNNIIMSGSYAEGESFGIHTDTGLYFDKKAGEKTRWTLLIYLNSDFSGGDTVFLNEMFQETRIVKPETGTALVFDIDLWHKGEAVTMGKKHWIGCEIIDTF